MQMKSRKDTGLCCGSRLRKGEVFADVGLPQNLKDLKVSAYVGSSKNVQDIKDAMHAPGRVGTEVPRP